ncbi:hypothetical protein M2318_005471 [Metapseudomonas resinovorans]|uniref:hypothetical protein n=1 Tax=Metapseudomonas resinovorans TaxID=53412 RepID=UPI003D2510BC
MRDQIQQTSRATFIRETSGQTTTTVIAVTSCQETIYRLHHEFRFFDDICLMQVDELKVNTRLDFPRNFNREQLGAGRCFLLLDEKQLDPALERSRLAEILPNTKFAELSPDELQETIDRIKETTRKSRKRPH